jgi:hypothetical protein
MMSQAFWVEGCLGALALRGDNGKVEATKKGEKGAIELTLYY